jgi:uncharacterized protein (TIGR02453 family)
MLLQSTLQFLEDLKANNNRDWFLEHKKPYEAFKKDYLDLVSDLLNALKPHDSSLEMTQIKDCAFRINRDIRFSKDKSPYKTHLGIGISGDGKQMTRAHYYLHIEKNACFVGGGVYMPMPDQLLKIRKEIAFFYDDLNEIIENKKFKSTFGNFTADENLKLKNPPKGFEKEHPAVEFLKFKSFTAGTTFDLQDATKKEFVSKVVAIFLILKPFNDFLNRALETDE